MTTKALLLQFRALFPDICEVFCFGARAGGCPDKHFGHKRWAPQSAQDFQQGPPPTHEPPYSHRFLEGDPREKKWHLERPGSSKPSSRLHGSQIFTKPQNSEKYEKVKKMVQKTTKRHTKNKVILRRPFAATCGPTVRKCDPKGSQNEVKKRTKKGESISTEQMRPKDAFGVGF